MSDTIIVALITFASGALGTVVGAISSALITKYNSQKEWRASFYASRSEAYQRLLDASVDYEKNNSNLEKLAALRSAANTAELLASQETRDAISSFRKRMEEKDFRSASMLGARDKMLSLIQQDLLCIPAFKIRKLRGFQK